ncbi:hypothetical protein [Pedobacter cryoconitis]|uniref:hypothetical protein n=1 Tax=Pedobacter cryoconitis TaxID=188932 RepID=UPI001612E6C4|nr:hypothetical protein [Pedobacter cryoconitis]MBB5644840.1 hypothetical protein [Pedobacter cryoconitis]
MQEEKIKKAIDFLGVKVLNTLEEKAVVGGNILPPESHDHTDEGRHHSHHDHP